MFVSNEKKEIIMKWIYRYPYCREERTINWEDRKKSHKCHKTGESYKPPTLKQQKDAYIDSHN